MSNPEVTGSANGGRKGTLPTKRRSEIVQPVDGTSPLEKSELSRLHRLAYKNEHIQELSLTEARLILRDKKYRPGSAAFLKNQVNPLTGTKGVEGIAGAFSDEEIEKRNKGKAEPSNIFVQTDEYTQRSYRGDNPLDAVLLQYSEANPGRRYRLENPKLDPAAGPGWQPVYENGKRVEVAGMVLGWMPEDVYDESYRKPNALRSQQMTGEVSNNPREDQDVSLKGEDARMAKVEGKGLHVGPSQFTQAPSAA